MITDAKGDVVWETDFFAGYCQIGAGKEHSLSDPCAPEYLGKDERFF